MMTNSLAGRVAIVTGAGRGIGRAHALALARRGAKVVVNDLGVSRSGADDNEDTAAAVVAEIARQGGEAVADTTDICDLDAVEQMANEALRRWGRIDILVNNAGFLRDRTFSKLSMADFRAVVEVHLMGTANCCYAVWERMKAQEWGRIVVTTSSSGLYGNFGQSNYGAAKMAVVGLMNTLQLEGERYGIRVNALAPAAATRMTDGLIDPAVSELLAPEHIATAMLALCAEDAPRRAILCCGAGGFALAQMFETQGIRVEAQDQTPEALLARWAELADEAGQVHPDDAAFQTNKFVSGALAGGNKPPAGDER